MAHSDIDRVNGVTIRRLHSPDKAKTFGYITSIKNANGDLGGEIGNYSTLTEARNALGFTVTTDAKTATLPKSAHPQNQKGYKRGK